MIERTMKGRIDDRLYRDLPEEGRTAFVVGMIDLLESLEKYFDEKIQAALEPLLNHTRPLGNDELRREFDRYLDESRNRKENGPAASSFLAMLLEKRYTPARR
jgi:hypothetical protein